jgi:adenosylhomocysteine nucleosidase
VIAAHRPRWVISAGFAGGLDPELARHDLVMADTLVEATGERVTLDLDARLTTLDKAVRVGAILTADRVIRSPGEKRVLGERYAALAVDTESMAVWRACQPRGVPMLAIRILTDGVDDRLPADIQHLTNQTTAAARLGAALAAIWRRPRSFKDLWALKETALVGSDRLAQFLARVIATLS